MQLNAIPILTVFNRMYNRIQKHVGKAWNRGSPYSRGHACTTHTRYLRYTLYASIIRVQGALYSALILKAIKFTIYSNYTDFTAVQVLLYFFFFFFSHSIYIFVVSNHFLVFPGSLFHHYSFPILSFYWPRKFYIPLGCLLLICLSRSPGPRVVKYMSEIYFWLIIPSMYLLTKFVLLLSLFIFYQCNN